MPDTTGERTWRRRATGYVRQNAVAFLALFVALGGTGAYAANTIGSADVIDESLLSQDVKNGTIGTADLAVGSVWGTRVKDGGIVAGKLGTNAVGATAMADNAIGSAEVKSNSLTNADIDESTLGVSVQGGRTTYGPSAYHQNCSPVVIATRTFDVAGSIRLQVDGTARYFADADNFGQAEMSIEVRDSSNAVVGSMSGSFATTPANSYGTLDVEGILSTGSDVPLVLTPGTYSVSLRGYAYGTCAERTFWSRPTITYLRVGNAD